MSGAGAANCGQAAGSWGRAPRSYLVTRLTGRTEEMLLCLFYDIDGAFAAEQSWKERRHRSPPSGAT